MGYLADIGAWSLAEAHKRRTPRHFAAALTRPGLALIAEVKRASPSQGPIAIDASAVAVAKAYEAAGAAAISILTCRRDFSGSLADLEAVRDAVAVPLLAKDFFVDPWQVIEARTHGADAILVIMELVDDALAQALSRQAEDLGMDVVCEAHSEPQVARAMRLGFPIIGINARDLDTLEVDTPRQLRLISGVPPGFLVIGESGIASVSDARRVAAAGAGAVLVGTALMRNPDLLGELVQL